jgi:cell fate regulator YaaT (PSP1 superfamily)
MAYVVRYGRMRFLGQYEGPDDRDHRRGERVVIRSDRGTELGEVLCTSTERTSSFLEQTVRGAILRTATRDDLDLERSLNAAQQEAYGICQEFISKRRLQMDLVDVEIILGRERIVFFYLAVKRVDFRELVKDLARTLRTRIEMRQIGVRDEAKLLADYGDCGKPVCCNTHLTAMPPVSMKMAKLQKTTLDPAKISGRCGRLKCCLRYEFDTYRTLERELPAVGSLVTTSKGRGRVVAHEILAQKLVVEYDDRRRIIIGRDDVRTVEPPKARSGDSRLRNPAQNSELEVPAASLETAAEFEPESGPLSDLHSLREPGSVPFEDDGDGSGSGDDDRVRG